MEATAEPVTSTLTPTAVETSTPSSAPTTPEPSSTPSINQPRKAISAREALERTATPSPAATTDKPAGAITPPAETATPGETTPPAATAPPEARWPTILDNARKEATTQAVQARDAQWQQEVGWVMQMPAEQRAGARNIIRDVYANPVAFVSKSVTELLRGPQADAIKAALLPLLGQPKSSPAEEEPQPDVEIRDDNGRVVGMGFSADRALKREAFLKKNLLAEVDQRFAPIQREREQAQARADALRIDQETKAKTDTVMSRLTKLLEGNREAWAHVDGLIARGMDPVDAALDARDKFIVPGVQSKADADAVDRMRRKAQANTANGSGAISTPASRPKTSAQLSKLLQELDGANS